MSTLLGAGVALEQDTAEQADAPSRGPINGVDASDSTYQAPVPQHEHGPGQQEAQEYKKGKGSDDGSDDVHNSSLECELREDGSSFFH